MSASPLRQLVRDALDPHHSVVVAACAGSGKTWLLVSRIVRLLLSGVPPGEILAITFTRHAAQEMAERLRDWLEMLAGADAKAVCNFLRERALSESDIDDAVLARARSLHEDVLRADPPLTISTFHSWYLQLLRSAPLSAAAIGNPTLTEQTSALVDEAWAMLAAECQREPHGTAARSLDALFRQYGLHSTRELLSSFLAHRADWWAYACDGPDALEQAIAAQAQALGITASEDVLGRLFSDSDFVAALRELAHFLERNTPGDGARAAAIEAALSSPDRTLGFEHLRGVFFTTRGELRKTPPSKARRDRLGDTGERRFLELHARLGQRVADTVSALCDQASLRINAAGLAAGRALLEHYQAIKRDRQVVDFADVEWLAYHLLARSDQAVAMQFKLDSRYRHILLDEFQDTNPLQWLALKAWFEAAMQADSHPVVFLVGDPKQAIYRFRRAEARLFDEARRWLEKEQGAAVLSQDQSRRCAQPVLDVVNALFGAQPDYEGFNPHSAHDSNLPGRVEVLPLALDDDAAGEPTEATAPLRDPLSMPLQPLEDVRREREALLLVVKLRLIVGRWEVVDEARGGGKRVATFGDVMILVQRRTHVQVYERALRHAGIPFTTSRQGGLLDTLEASDLIALLAFLVSPFDNLKLAHALRSPIFGCSDEDLLKIAAAPGESWWQRLLALELADELCPLARARKLLACWLERADRMPVHDHLDRIYCEADIEGRYAAAVPEAVRAAVVANLHAFLERALAADSGRYPSLPRFLDEIGDLRSAPLDEAPDEGRVTSSGDAVRILTVHGAKGLEAPIVWLLDTGAQRPNDRGYDVMVDWPPRADRPSSFTLRTRSAEMSRLQRAQQQQERSHAAREDANLLSVAMTRARQALIVSGCDGRGLTRSWYQRLQAAVVAARGGAGKCGDNAPLVYGDELVGVSSRDTAIAPFPAEAAAPATLPPAVLPTGVRRATLATEGQRYGSVFHRVMECMTTPGEIEPPALARRLGIAVDEAERHMENGRRLVKLPALRRYFDERLYLRAFNELSVALANGEVRRLDRVVEFPAEAWVLDYKTGRYDEVRGTPLETEYRLQVSNYCDAMRQVFRDKMVRGVLVFSDGRVVEATD